MAIYHYMGRDKTGKQVAGSLDASSSGAVAEQLQRQQIIPLSIKLAEQERQSANVDIGKYLQSKTVKTEETIMFCRQMYALMRSGVPILSAINGLAENSKSVALQLVLKDVHQKLEQGYSLSAAMSNHSKVFDALTRAVIHVGENTGQLDQSFNKLAQYLSREQETRKNVKQAVRYPIFVVIALVLAMFAINIWVIPVFAEMFAQFDTELPLVTRWLINTSNFFVNYWLFMVVIIAVSVVVINQYLNTESGLYRWDRRKLKLPVIGDIIERALLARFAQSFAIVMRAGIPVTTGLNLSAAAIGNSYMQDKVTAMRQRVETGEPLTRTATASGLFTPLVLQMLAVGEETGRIDELLEEVAGYYEREVDYDLKSLTDRIEPILITVMAILVLILALGIFTPMWDMYSVVQG